MKRARALSAFVWALTTKSLSEFEFEDCGDDDDDDDVEGAELLFPVVDALPPFEELAPVAPAAAAVEEDGDEAA